MHRHGRIFTALGLLVMIGVPVTIWLVTGVSPDVDALVIGVVTLSMLQLPGGIIEVATYSPFLGTSATYLAFITGNLANLKIPCVMNARAICKTKMNTPENEVVATLSVSASTVTTIAVMVIGVVLLIPLRPILNSPVLRPAFNWVVPALFGALGYKYFKGNPILIVAPLIFVVVLSLLVPSFVHGNIAVMIVLTAIVSLLAAKILHAKGMLAEKDEGE
jgi:hypothetical protein